MTFPELTPVYTVYRFDFGGGPCWNAATGYVGTINGAPVLLVKDSPTHRGYHDRDYDPADWHPTPEAAKIAAAAKWQGKCATELASLLAMA